MDVEYLIDEEDLVEITGLSPRSIRSKFKRFRVEDKEYDYQAIFEELLKEKYSNKNKQIFVVVFNNLGFDFVFVSMLCKMGTFSSK